MSKIFFTLQFILLIIFAVLSFYFFPIGGKIDQAMILPFIDSTHGFIYKNFWWYDHFAHHDLKLLQEFIIITMFIGVFSAKFNFKRFPIKYPKEYAHLLGFMFMSMMIVGILKKNSVHSCPWYILDISQKNISFITSRGQGGCFPGGHASLGYAWMAGFFVFYLNNKVKAYFYLIAGILLGTAMGYTQMMRGAHFLSHNLWTMWLSYAVHLILYLCLINRLNRVKR